MWWQIPTTDNLCTTWNHLTNFFLKTNFFNYYILGCGHFLYFEASNRETGSALSAPFTSTSGEMCLCFSLSMYSLDPKTMGSLSLSLMKGNTFVKSFWDISGSVTANQTSWDKIHLNLPALNANSDYKVSWRFLTVWFFFNHFDWNVLWRVLTVRYFKIFELDGILNQFWLNNKVF